MKVAARTSEAAPDTAPPESGARVIDGRYRLGPRLGAGAGGSVFAARDLLLEVDVALKLVPHGAGDPSGEFLLARTLVHPHVVRVHDVGRAGPGETWFTMDLLADADLMAVRARHGLEGVLRVALGAARALDYVHGRGFIHGDVKPANVLAPAGAGGVEARLIDFGLATGEEGALRGTPAYMAPELTRGELPDATADLYALGVTLYEAWTGANPFRAPTLGETLDRQRTLVPPPADAPPLFAAILSRLLQKRPEARYADARALLHALTDAAPEVAANMAAAGAPMPAGCGPFFGREGDLAGLLARTGARALVGPAGAGKTRLLDELAPRARLRGLRVLRAGGSSPVEAIARALACAEGPRSCDEPLAARLSQVATLLLVDDLDRAGGAAREAFGALMSGVAESPRVSVVVASRAPIFDSLPVVALAPLTRADFQALVGATLGGAVAEGRLASLLHDAAGGWPGRLARILEAQAASGAVAWREGRWTVDPRLLDADPAALARSCAPQALDTDRLSAGERALLEPASVLGDRFSTAVLAALAGDVGATEALVVDGEATRFADPALAAAIYAALPEDRRVAWHRRAAEVIARVAPDDAESLARHLDGCGRTGEAVAAMARAVEATRRPDHRAELCRFIAVRADDPSWHERAGDAAVVAGDLEAARADFSRAGGAPRAVRKLGFTYTDEGRYAEALPLLATALEAAVAAGEGDEVLAGCFAVGWTAMMSGDYARAAELSRLGLEKAGDREVDAVARLWRLEGTIAWHQGDAGRAVSAFEHGREIAERTGDAHAAADCLMGLGTARRIAGNLPGAASAYELAAAGNEALSRWAPVAKCFNNLGIVHYLAGRWDEAARAWERFRDTCMRTGDRSDLVMGHNNLGFLYKDRGELERAEVELERGRAVAEAAGFTRGLAMVLGNLGEVLARRGRPADARPRLETACRLAEAIDSRDELLENRRRLAALALVEGDAERALHEADEALGDARSHGNTAEEGQLLWVRGEALRQLGRLDEALFELGRARELLARAGGPLDGARVALRLVDAELARDPEVPGRLVDDARTAGTRFGALDVIRDADRLGAAIRQREAHGRTALESVLSVARELALELDLDRLLSLIAERALEVTGADRGLVILYEPNGEVRLGGARWRDGDNRDHLALRISRTIADRVHREGRAVVVTDVETESDLRQQASILAMQLRTIVCVPLAARDQTLGLLYVDSQRAQQHFEVQDLSVLEALAAQAAVAVQNARLFEAERRRRELVALVAQDIQTPVNAVRTALDMVVQAAPNLDRDLRNLLITMSDQLERLDRLTSDAIDLESIDQDGISIAPTEMDLSELLMLTTFYLDPLARAHKVELVVEPGAELPPALADADRVTQILTHLVGCSLKCVPAGGHIRVGAELVDRIGPDAGREEAGLGWSPKPTAGGPWIRVRVADDGPVLSPEALAQLRAPGRRAGAVGLSLARELVDRQGGTLWAAVGAASGTTYYFTLPVAIS